MYALRCKLIALSSVVAAVAVTATAPARLAAQDVQYETVTRTELPGALGTAVRIAARLGGSSMETVERTSIKGRRMRVDSDRTSTITDLENGRITYLDHDAKTYSTYTFEEMIQRAREAGAQAQASGSRATSNNADAEATVDFRFSVDDARERARFQGYDAQRFFLTMEAQTEYIPEDSTELQDGGTLVVLTDMWSSKDVPVLAARAAFDQASAQEYAAAGAALTEGIAAAFADDPQMRVGFRQSMEEAKKIEGIPVRTVMHFVVVAPDREFDREAIVNPRPAGASAAGRAARAGLGRLAARAGARAPEPQAAEEPSQVVMLKVSSEIRNVRSTAVDPSVFEVPAGYSEVKPGG